MPIKTVVSIDLGNDTTKIAFSYREKNGFRFKTYIGKIVELNKVIRKNFSSIARYEEETKTWVYANDVNNGFNSTSSTIVKIKELMSLLSKPSGMSDSVFLNNKDYFYNKKVFPKYYFPETTDRESLNKLEKSKDTFTANLTPREVCVNYFRYLSLMIKQQLDSSFDIELCVVYPISSGKTYRSELIRIIEEAFNKKVDYKIDSTRAICAIAYHTNLIDKDDKVLVFEIGDQNISVLKASVNDKDGKVAIYVEGKEGHKDPERIGGNDIDRAISDSLKNVVSKRVLFGTDSSNNEEISVGKQYILSENIKMTKKLISSQGAGFEAPINIPSEVNISHIYSSEQLAEAIGITGNKGVAKKLLNYIESELKYIGNKDVTKVIIAGGGIETYGLFDYFKKKIEKGKDRYIKVHMIDIDTDDSSYLNITKKDDSTYAAAMGASLAFTEKYDIETVFSLTYGTEVTHTQRNYQTISRYVYYEIFIEKGTSITTGQRINGMYRFYLGGNKNASGVFSPQTRIAYCNSALPIYSMNVTQSEINSRKHSGIISYDVPNADRKTVIKITDKSTYEKLKNLYDLKLIAGANDKPSFNILKNGVKQYDLNLGYDVYVYLDVTEEGKVYPGVELVNVRNSYGYIDKKGVSIILNGVDSFESEYMG